MITQFTIKINRYEKLKFKIFTQKSNYASKPKKPTPQFDTSYKESIRPGFKLVNKTVGRPYKYVLDKNRINLLN